MGYIIKKVVVVSAYNSYKGYGLQYASLAHKKAKKMFGKLCSPLIEEAVNGEFSFFIAPDGSKEGWEMSQDYEEKRKEFFNWIETYKYEDGSRPIKYVELHFGGDLSKPYIESSN